MTSGVHVLGNGIRMIPVPIAGTEALTALIAYPAGSRCEQNEESGVAHFLEHLVFKGGRRFPTYRAVNYRADEIGARLNAYTGKEMVAFYVTLAGNEASAGLDLLTDFVASPLIPEAGLEVERGVVLQEIGRAEDQPATVASYLLAEAAYGPGSGLGHRTLGSRAVIRSISREQVLAFRERAWVSDRGVLVLAGNLSALDDDDARKLGERLPRSGVELAVEPAASQEPTSLIKAVESKQSHLRLCWRLGNVDPISRRARAAMHIYNNVLGGMTSSRLFEEIREERGLCYSINSYGGFYSDDVSVNIASGLQPERVGEACERILAIVEELGADGLSEGEVERARAARLGELSRVFESSGSVARNVASASVIYGHELTPEQVFKEATAATFDEVREIASAVAQVSRRPASALVGPHDRGSLPLGSS